MPKGNINEDVVCTANFPPSVLQLFYTLYTKAGVVDTPRTSVGVVSLGNGQFAVTISKPTPFAGIILWDDGQGRVASEDVSIEDMPGRVWAYPERTLTELGSVVGVGPHALAVAVTMGGALSAGHEVYLFDVLKKPYRAAKTNAQGVATFRLPNGAYYAQAVKGGTWPKEVAVTVAGADAVVTIDTTTATVPGFVTFTLEKLPDSKRISQATTPWLPGEVEKLGVKVVCDQGPRVAFVVSTASVEVDGAPPVAAVIEGHTVYFTAGPFAVGTHEAVLTVEVGGQVLKEVWTISVEEA